MNLARGLDLALRSGALPLFLGLRMTRRGARPDGDVPAPERSVAMALKIALDEAFLCTEMLSAPIVRPGEMERLGRELRRARGRFEREGWIAEPARYHPTPPALTDAEITTEPGRSGRLRGLRFASGYEPHPREPGRTRWLALRANRTAHAWLVEHPGAPRPCVVCVPGYRMGHPRIDFASFRVRWLHRRLGLNVAIAVLPLHGPRRSGARGGDGFLRGDFVDTVHAQAQAVWDVRRLCGWLRRRGTPALAAHGVSLGSYTAALLAALEPLDCVIAGNPAVHFLDLLRAHMPGFLYRLLERFGVDFASVDALLRVVSPLALPPLLPREHRFVYAGVADRLSPPDQAVALWRHWGEPRIAWYQGSHVSSLFEPDVARFVETALAETGLIGTRPGSAR